MLIKNKVKHVFTPSARFPKLICKADPKAVRFLARLKLYAITQAKISRYEIIMFQK